ncbi:hypothetical protein [Streptomyces sp. NPDC051909]|uniref:helix-turn-helix domain-containing protein n=1 Tax=Streptomyces sp. NPDC051909 TaxID=3154944 RepID=UPI00341589CD
MSFDATMNAEFARRAWRSAAARLAARGLLDPAGLPNPAARALRTHIESRTDTLAARPYAAALSPAEADRTVALLGVLADEVLDSGTIPFPNPMGPPARKA